MADIKQQLIDFGMKIGLLKDDNPKPSQPQNNSQQNVNVQQKTNSQQVNSNKFDFNLFMEVSKTYWSNFFKVEIPNFFKDPNKYLKNYGTWFKALAQPEKIAHISVYCGSLFIVTGLVLMIVGL